MHSYNSYKVAFIHKRDRLYGISLVYPQAADFCTAGNVLIFTNC